MGKSMGNCAAETFFTLKFKLLRLYPGGDGILPVALKTQRFSSLESACPCFCPRFEKH